ncbi:MAG: hypothetical protein ACI9D5_002735 [Candidatus Endobugula sp.]|jgi:uncharacterized protein (DUF2164 family)
MSEIKFSKDEVTTLTKKIQLYLSEELDKEIGQFDAQFLLDFISAEMGPYYYNRGLYDAQTILESKMENITDAILEIEKITEFRK